MIILKMKGRMGNKRLNCHGSSCYKLGGNFIVFNILVLSSQQVLGFHPSSFVQQLPAMTNLSFVCYSRCSEFPRVGKYNMALLDSKLFDPSGDGNAESNKDDDELGTPLSGELSASMSGGQDLARQFYKQVQQNEKLKSIEEKRIDNDNELETEEEYYNINPPSSTTNTASTTKFTGQGYVPPNSTPLPGPGSASSGSSFGNADSSRPSPQDEMFKREFNLADRAASSIKFQAIFAVLALAFYIYIGATGGIVSGGFDDDTEDFIFNADGTSRMMDSNSLRRSYMGEDMLPPEDFVPIQKDSETSVWL